MTSQHSDQDSLSEESHDARSVRPCLMPMELELQSQRLRRTQLEQFLMDEVCQDLAAISYLLAAVQLPKKVPEDIEVRLARVSELLATTLSRCMNFQQDQALSQPAGDRIDSARERKDMAPTIDRYVDP